MRKTVFGTYSNSKYPVQLAMPYSHVIREFAIPRTYFSQYLFVPSNFVKYSEGPGPKIIIFFHAQLN